MLRDVWGSPDYIRRSWRESEHIFWGNPALVRLAGYAHVARRILDVGCGDGRIIAVIWRRGAEFWGLDVVRKFKLKKSNVRFTTEWKFKNKFDLVYSTYVFEHLAEPEEILEKMDGVLERGGKLVVVCPNFGSPLEYSPCYSGNLRMRAIRNALKSWGWMVWRPQGLEWEKVKPRVLSEGRWEQDWDTMCEPCAQTLEIYLKKGGYKILECASGFGQTNRGWVVRLFTFLGKLGMAPFKYWGPTICIVAEKK